jgi:Homeobox KN domain
MATTEQQQQQQQQQQLLNMMQMNNVDMYDDDDDDDDLDDEGGGSGKKSRGKSRRELPTGAVATLKAWLLSPEHFTHPYPTPQDQAMLMSKTGIDKKQLKNWFTNARRRIWKPLLKKQIEQGTITATPAGVPGTVPGLVTLIPGMAAATAAAALQGNLDNPHSIQAMRTHYQQAVGQTQAAAAAAAAAAAVAQPTPSQPQVSYGELYIACLCLLLTLLRSVGFCATTHARHEQSE